MEKVALLGLGIMGTGMANNLLKAGFPLTVWNRTLAKAEALRGQGAQVASTPREAAAEVEVVISMVGDDQASRSVWTGENGALAGAKAATVLVECSTLSPEWIRELAALASKHGCQLLDSPVMGSKGAASDASLKLLVGGDAAALERVRPVLEKISVQITYFGRSGDGAVMKLINNMMAAVHIAALSEGITLAERSGMNMEQVIATILNGASASGIVKGKMDRMLAHKYDDTEFALRWMEKDMSYAVELATDLGLPLSTVKGAKHVFDLAHEKGLAESDWSAAIEGLRS